MLKPRAAVPEQRSRRLCAVSRPQTRPLNENRLFAQLPRADFQRLTTHLEPASLSSKQILYEPGDALAHVYFLRSGMVSMITPMRNGMSIEVATIGSEGMVGLPAFLGADAVRARYLVQIPGEALRLRTDILRQEAARQGAFHRLLNLYTNAFLIQEAQTVACNGLHTVKQRCGRWLLLTHDRVRANEFPLTQEFFAQMLGVRRASVAEVARMLQRTGLIRYRRGQVTVLNRDGLEKAACECYSVIKTAFGQVLAHTRE
jgi:CRP-like cAMP-binding protein